MDLPTYDDARADEPWRCLERHVSWMLQLGYARVGRTEVVTWPLDGCWRPAYWT